MVPDDFCKIQQLSSPSTKEILFQLCRIVFVPADVPDSCRMEQQQKVADCINLLLRKEDSGEWMLLARVTGKNVLFTRYYPILWFPNQEINTKRSSVATPYGSNSADTYCYGIFSGAGLGLGEMDSTFWYLVLGDSEGFYYFPAHQIQVIHSLHY